MTSTVPHFPLSDPEFDTTSEVVHRTRDERWWVETDYGWAVLTYEKSAALLRDRRFRQGNAKWPEQNGIHSGRFSGWWKEVLLSLEGDDHARIRRLLMPAFRNKVIAAMRPQFQALAGELIDGFASRGEVEFISEFAEPYSARILCQLLGLPEDNWHQVAKWADDLGKSFGIAVKDDLPRIEAAIDGLYGYVDEVVGQRMAEPADDLVTTLVQASTEEDGRLDGTSWEWRWSSWRSPGWRRPATSSGSRCRPSWPTRTSGGCSPSSPISAATPSRR